MRSLFVVVAIPFLLGVSFVNAADRGDKLFRLLETPRSVSAPTRTSLASKREADITFDRAVTSAIVSSARLDLTLFDDRVFTAVRQSVETRAGDDVTWRGKIVVGKWTGDVILTFRHGYVAGLIYSPDAVYEIVPKGDRQILIELDQSVFPECAGDVKGVPQPVAVGRNPEAGVDSGDRIDVLVVYTTATKNNLGGDAQAQTHAQQAIDATNTAYINSKINQRVRMVHTQEFVYTETASGQTDLSNLRANASIGTLRDTHNADLVAMIGEIQGACGVGYLMGGAVGGNSNNAFTVTARSCAVGNLSFAHELGHNMGSQHNPENGSGPTYPYGFGHYVNGSYRTVMSYVDPCTSGCTRVAYFSNPRVIFNGQPTGIDNARDNARSINATANAIAAYRYSGASITLGNHNGNEIVPRLLHRSLIWTSDNVTGDVKIEFSRDGGTTWTTLFNPTPNDNQEYFTFGNRVTRRGRIRITSLSNPTVSDTSVNNISLR